MSANGEKKRQKLTAELITHCLKFYKGNKSSNIIQNSFKWRVGRRSSESTDGGLMFIRKMTVISNTLYYSIEITQQEAATLKAL